MSTAAEAAAKYPPGTPVTLRCERMLHGGVCAARHPDLGIVLVEHAIPGELVEAQLRFRAKRTWFATVQRVLQPSPDRVEVPCKYVPECGGCQLQHVAYERQLELKREVLLEALRHDHVETVTTIGLHGVEDPWRYRIRGEFHVVRGGDDGGEVGLGFNRSRSWRPIAVDDCLIHDRRITEALPQLRALVQHAGTPELRTVHVTAGDDDDLLVRGMPRSALDAAALPGEGRRLSTEWTTLRWRDLLFRARSDTFIQVNWAQMDVLYARVLAALGSYTGLRVVDAYAGIGVLACAL
ncbi:MAG TPA: hypothetical protein VJU79_04380, partial [Candidatus Dormibacteraeota bacterium]|nr:hypothetical protein [Candidatus Dormibacteraeota bacterium]